MVGGNYAKAPVAQIRGGFINWEWLVCESVWWEEIMRRLPVAQIRGGFINWEWLVCESWDVCEDKLRCATGLFYEKTEHIY
jgi:drug/metabolite transporter superfamily protein YnfA